MTLVGLLVFVAIAAVVIWVINQIPTFDPSLKRFLVILIYAIVAIIIILWIASLFGYNTRFFNVIR
jgi:hypothetical protein